MGNTVVIVKNTKTGQVLQTVSENDRSIAEKKANDYYEKLQNKENVKVIALEQING